ncbi:uncharacterized protein LOC127419729 isoform X2 [Myxocyprinus asiaticus]|uniref:uncharacterized protein LOC127419729 isoform X2 n=1 Tax=Myxocyprinus asiaticus TaxID=70543 RepID=UPI0022230F06|nr:uncharacterized protein LOC127419729 isoform X2 [Myxocyprinus asiaticus]
MLATLETIQYFQDLGPRELSSGNVDLDVIEEYLQEHSVEVMSGLCVQRRSEEEHSMAENSWSGRYTYEWHYGGISGTDERHEQHQQQQQTWLCQSSPSEWGHCQYDRNQCSDSDSLSTSSGCQEFPPSLTADRKGQIDCDSLALVPLSDTRYEELHLVGPVQQWHFPVLLPEQGEASRDVGQTQGQPQDHDLPENGSSFKKLLTNWRNLQSEAKTHLSVH